MHATLTVAPAAAGAVRSFSTHHVIMLLFDCALWPGMDAKPQLLVSYMTGVMKPDHTLFAEALCRQSLAAQFPQFFDDCGVHLEVQALHRELAVIAENRAYDLGKWLEKLEAAAGLAVDLGQRESELLFQWADKLDWCLRMPERRDICVNRWVKLLCRHLLKIPLTLDVTTLHELVRDLDGQFQNHEQRAQLAHGRWVEARRQIAGLPERVPVERLPVNTYTEQHFRVEQQLMERKSPFKDAPSSRTAWQRLDFFRIEAKASHFYVVA